LQRPFWQAETGFKFAAANLADRPGICLDFTTVSGNQTNYLFACDSTYYISSALYLFQTNVFEGGTCIKASSTYFGSASSPRRNRYFAALARVPEEAQGGGLGLLLLALGLAVLPREKRRQLALALRGPSLSPCRRGRFLVLTSRSS
jgi:hypothetical protein